MSERLVIGVTGPIACGKSSVAARLAEHDAVVLDADLVYRELIRPGRPLTEALAGRFGPSILTGSGEIDRRALGKIVFSDAEALADLDRITHPAIVAEIERKIAELDAPLIVIEAVKLSQGGAGRLCDETWLVTCEPAAQIERLARRNNLPREEAERRIASQATYDPAGFTRTIANNADLATLHASVDAALAEALDR